jgi:methyl-accepting chemotaxis protein
MSIEQLYQMPTMEKQENGDYTYPAKYINRVFKSNDKLIHFTKSATTEYPLALLDSISGSIKEELKSNQQEEITTLQESIESLQSQLSNTSDLLANRVEDNQDRAGEIEERLTEVESSIGDIKDKITLMSKKLDAVQTADQVQAIIRSEMQAVKENFDSVMKEAIKKEAERLIAESKKLDPMTVLMLTKQGMGMAEVVELAKAGVL